MCHPCNNRFGHEVDRIVDAPRFLYLRAEAGLPTNRQVEGEYFDDDWGHSSKVTFDPNQDAFDEVRHLFEREDRVLIQAPTAEEARQLAKKWASRRGAEGQSVHWDEPYARDLTGKVITISDQGTLGEAQVTALLIREAAKIAIEYVAYVSTPNVAGRSDLDPIRKAAMQGTAFRGHQLSFLLTGPVYLPRTGAIWVIGTKDDALRAKREMEKRRAQGDSYAGPPADFPRLTEIFHRLRLVRHGDGGYFELVLFGWFVVRLALPPELSVPWGRYHLRDFRRDKTASGVA